MVIKDAANRDKEIFGASLAVFTFEVARECSGCGVHWPIENPRTSKLWSLHPMLAFQGLSGAPFVHFDLSERGSIYKKPTSILTNLQTLDVFDRKFSHKRPHVPLKGKVKLSDTSVWVNRTVLAGAYP